MKSFKYAFSGLAYAIAHERSMRIHLCFTFYVICAGLVTRIDASAWAAVIICIGLVMALESFNTALEKLCDTLKPEKNEGIRIVKDVSAAAVLVSAIASAAVGISIFFRAEQLENFKLFLAEKPLLMALIALTLVPAVIFTVKTKAK